MATDVAGQNRNAHGHRFEWLEWSHQLSEPDAPAGQHEHVDERVEVPDLLLRYPSGHQDGRARSLGGSPDRLLMAPPTHEEELGARKASYELRHGLDEE